MEKYESELQYCQFAVLPDKVLLKYLSESRICKLDGLTCSWFDKPVHVKCPTKLMVM